MFRIIAVLALVIAVLSLALNVILIQRLFQSRDAALKMLDQTSAQLDTLPDMSIKYTAHVKQNFSAAGSMPFQQTFTVPVNQTIPIDNTFNVNVTTPFGPMNMPIAVKSSFPVSMTMSVPISMTVPYSVTVPIDLDVPVNIALRDLGFEPTIRQAQQEIEQMRATLQ